LTGCISHGDNNAPVLTGSGGAAESPEGIPSSKQSAAAPVIFLEDGQLRNVMLRAPGGRFAAPALIAKTYLLMRPRVQKTDHFNSFVHISLRKVAKEYCVPANLNRLLRPLDNKCRNANISI
jgi:hypothetical protein